MVLDIKMCRFDNVPWGFRLVGGSDFEYPLTVVKVNEGSIAEEAGLRVGDVIVRINDTPTTPLTHDETNRIITSCGNVFYFGVYREDTGEPENTPKQFPLLNTERTATPESMLNVSSSCRSPLSIAHSDDYRQVEYLPELADRPCSVLSENTEIKLVEEEIAAVLSGESEVLQEHNVMGIFPKPGVCMSSDVLRTLNEEATKTKAEKDKENRKWTTFLQKPDRPIPKSKAQIEAERRAANAYKIKIVKSAPLQPKTPEPAAVVEKKTEPPKELTPPDPADDEPLPTDSEMPNLDDEISDVADKTEDEKSTDDEKIDKEKETSPETKETAEDNKQTEEADEPVAAHATNEEVNIPTAELEQVKTEEELALERQLVDVQKQLAALSSLPSTIQATLDAVTKQLAELLPTFKLQQTEPTRQQQKLEAMPREISLEKIDEEASPEESAKEDVAVSNEHAEQTDEKPLGNVSESVGHERRNTDGCIVEVRDNNDIEVASYDPAKRHEAMQSREETRQMEEELNLKKQKRNDVIEELSAHLERKNNPQKRSKRAFGPLTPSSERPLVLPGGRRWYRPKDAYNDEFIAETLSAQAELITGTTLGVNFMKYQKPEKKIDLNRSEVYKVIHHLDRQPVRGIEVRPPVVPAEVDIRKAVQS